jgi:archaellum component FlaC
MERTMWTDERLDERFDGIDRRFDAVDKRFDGVDRSLERIDRDIRDLRMLMFQLWGATMLGVFATIGTVIATSA